MADRRRLLAFISLITLVGTASCSSAKRSEPIVPTAPATTTVPTAAPTTTSPPSVPPSTQAPETATGDTSAPAQVPTTTTDSLAMAPTSEALPGVPDWEAVVASLGPLPLPSDCPLPLGSPGLLPNSDRSYRGGTHQGIDFVCLEPGHIATSPLPGRVVVAMTEYTEPNIADRDAILQEAQRLGATPPFTLLFLFGRFVVVDHGLVPGAGHVVTVYAHLDSVDPGVRPGAVLAAGAPVGRIGNSGTETAATGGTRPQSIHLHWELHVEGVPFPSGLDERRTEEMVALLFGG